MEAHGGIEKLKMVKNVVSDAQVTINTPMGQMDSKVVLYQIYPNKMRQDISTTQGEFSIIFDGKAASTVSAMGAQSMPPEMTTSLKDALFKDTIPLLINLTENGTAAQYTGTEDVLGKPTTVLLVKQPSGEMVKVYISEETYYVIKLAFRETEQGVTMDKEIIYSDFREVGGVKIAHHVIQNVDGELYTESRISSVKLNTELDESLLQVPE